LNYLSVCSGIDAVSVAWQPLGFAPVLYSEIERFPREVLAARHGACDVRYGKQGVPLWGDFTALRVRHLRRLGIAMPDVLVGGTPCQAFSIAGLRKLLADDRGNLALSFVRLANAIDHVRLRAGSGPLTVVWENVPGVLSVSDNAFGCFLAALVGADAPLVPCQRWTDAGMVVGPKRSAAWRILDAQHFGVAQRRERLFVVASARGPAYTSEILFERRGMFGNHPPRREERESTTHAVAPSLTGSSRGVERAGESRGQDPVVPVYRGVRLPESGYGTGAGEQRVPRSQPESEAESILPSAFTAFGGNNTKGPIDAATACNAKGGGRADGFRERDASRRGFL
jgi:DNA (cytosine-5)-methyltransferase 1